MEMSNNVDLLTPAWVWLCDTGPRCWLAVLSVGWLFCLFLPLGFGIQP